MGERNTGDIRGAEGGTQATPVGDHHQLVVERTCQHGRGGHCNIHGRGAVRKFRGGYKMSIGRGGGFQSKGIRGIITMNVRLVNWHRLDWPLIGWPILVQMTLLTLQQAQRGRMRRTQTRIKNCSR